VSSAADLECARDERLARALTAAARAETIADALRHLADAVLDLAGAGTALIRVLDGGRLETVAVAGSTALAAELEGSVLAAAELPPATLDRLDAAPLALRAAAARAGADSLLLVPVRLAGAAASLELLRAGDAFTTEERLAAELVAAEIGLVLRVFGSAPAEALSPAAGPGLELAADALAATLDPATAAAEIARIAVEVTGARAAVLWAGAEDDALLAAGSYGIEPGDALDAARELAGRALAGPLVAQILPGERLPAGCGVSTTVPLGRPPLGVLQLLEPPGDARDGERLAALSAFAARAADALRASDRAGELGLELDRTRALLAVADQATAELSVAHTLETAIERVAELLSVSRLAVYLRRADGGLEPAVARGLAGPHARVAERLLDVALGPHRGAPVVEVVDAQRDPRLEDVATFATDARIVGAVAVALTAGDDVVGLLAVYPDGRRVTGDRASALLEALAGQLAAAVQNAQVHEEAMRLGSEREQALRGERDAARRLGALYEVSRSFAQSLSLDETLKALARTVVDVLDLDVALVRMPDERRENLVPQALHVRDAQLEPALRPILVRPQPFGNRAVQRLFRDRRSHRLAPGDAAALAPFLRRGWTAAVVPVALPSEVLAALTIVSVRPDRPLAGETLEAASALAAQAALAIDNARLYQQQKRFADTMQRSLLPHTRPAAAGLDVGEVYDASARMDVGGDLYDFLALDDGRLAVVLGDVTGHGVDATADMAMAKFVFRSLAREHPEPGDFLAAANEVVCGEIAPGKFITMAYVVVDGVTGEVACASAGHPAPRLVLPGGEVRPLEGHGLVLGIDGGQEYPEQRAGLPTGGSLVLFTDGVVEARRNGELYGAERLDALLAERGGLPARALAAAVADDAREFAGGELSDDLAVVVIRRT
jgi:serine phosphatase RsbU (regulator of sigma subunit)